MKQTEKQSKKEKDMRSHVKQVSEGLEGMATQESKQTMIQVHFFLQKSGSQIPISHNGFYFRAVVYDSVFFFFGMLVVK